MLILGSQAWLQELRKPFVHRNQPSALRCSDADGGIVSNITVHQLVRGRIGCRAETLRSRKSDLRESAQFRLRLSQMTEDRVRSLYCARYEVGTSIENEFAFIYTMSDSS